MESIGENGRKEPNQRDGEYLSAYIQHLEKRIKFLENEVHLLKTECLKLNQTIKGLKNEIDRLIEPPLLLGTLIDVLDENQERVIIHSTSGPEFVVKTYNQVRKEKLTPGVSVALNQNTLAVMKILQPEIDPLVKGMEIIDTIPVETYDDVGGLEDQIQEVRETVELPLIKPELFKKVGIEPPKGVLFYGPPGTGKTLLAKAVAHETKTTFIRVVGSELVQKFIGEGARFVREIFDMARQKAPTILFIDELDAIASERMEDATSGDREVQRTLMQLLSELDGFDQRGDVKIIGATNRIDMLDRALLRPGRFDRMVEFPIPDERARESIFKIHIKPLNIDNSLNLKDLVKRTEYTTGADIKAICIEAGMFVIRRDGDVITQEDFIKAINKILKSKIEDISPDGNLFT